MEEIEKLLIKKASVAELQDVRQTLQRQIELIATQPSQEDIQWRRAHEAATDTVLRSSSALAYPSGTQLLDQNKIYDKIEALGRFVIQAQEKVSNTIGYLCCCVLMCVRTLGAVAAVVTCPTARVRGSATGDHR